MEIKVTGHQDKLLAGMLRSWIWLAPMGCCTPAKDTGDTDKLLAGKLKYDWRPNLQILQRLTKVGGHLERLPAGKLRYDWRP